MIDPRRLRCANLEGRQIRPVVGGGAAVPDRRKADAQSRAPKVTLPSLASLSDQDDDIILLNTGRNSSSVSQRQLEQQEQLNQQR
ncbi:MAG TPA: hypothetical protein VKI44_16845 [Acetobacteraceae bacterium]|nr:hypothetical protein [Acetobacteraceae bacterium]